MTLGGPPAGAPEASGSGTTDEVPSTGTGAQGSFAGSKPRSSWVPEVITAQSERWSRAEVLATTRPSSPRVLSSRALAGRGSAAWTTRRRIPCCSAQLLSAGKVLVWPRLASAVSSLAPAVVSASKSSRTWKNFSCPAGQLPTSSACSAIISISLTRAPANSRYLSALGWSPKVNPSSADSAVRLNVYNASPGSASRDSRTLIPDSDISRHNVAAAATISRPRVSSGIQRRFREVPREMCSGRTGLVPSCTTEENSAMMR